MHGRSITFDPAVVQESAQRLYGLAAAAMLKNTISGVQGIVVILAVIGGIGGLLRGRELAFKLKLEAQLALCQLQI